MSDTPLAYSYNAAEDILTVEGSRYSGSLMRALGKDGMVTGTTFEIVRSEDGGHFELKAHRRTPRQERAVVLAEAAMMTLKHTGDRHELARKFQIKAEAARRGES